jgi:hypothetical protein
MSRRKYDIAAITVAIVATFIGWWEIGTKIFPPMHLIIWFPSLIITNTFGYESGIFLSIVQFPALALCFILGIRRWSAPCVITVIVLIYAAMVLIAYHMAKG